MTKVSLFEWFALVVSKLTGKTLKGKPSDVLAGFGIPIRKYPWIEDVQDVSLPMTLKGNLEIPDLESRNREEKRGSGQYFTPEFLVEILYSKTKIVAAGKRILDPACGDGAFLVPAARMLVESKISTPLEFIWGYDLDPQALLICLGRLLQCAPQKGLPNLECRNFLTSLPVGEFEIVVGNPPYKVNLPLDFRELLAKKFKTAEGEKDLYTFFLEGGITSLNQGGNLLFLISHTFLVNHQCRKIRFHLFSENSVKNLFLLWPGFFRRAPGVLPVIIHVEKKRPSRSSRFFLFDGFEKDIGWAIRKSADPSNFLEPTGLKTTLRNPKLTKLFDEMKEKSVPLGEIAKIGVGIQESKNRDGKISRFVFDAPEGEHFVKVLRGKEISPFRINWEGKYLKYGDHLLYAGNPEVFKQPKILYQNIRNESLPRRLVAALDRDGFFPKNSLSYITEPKPPFTLEFLVGILNSSLINTWFREHFFSFHITVSQVKQIPVIVAPAFEMEKVKNLVLKLSSEFGKKHAEDFLKIDSEISAKLMTELDKNVTKCYFPERDYHEIVQLLSS